MTNFLDDQNASYDKLAKHFLSRKSILAQILKYTVEEFADCDVSDIEKKYIEGDPSLSINTIPLDDTLHIKILNQPVSTKVLSPSILFSMPLLPLTASSLKLSLTLNLKKLQDRFTTS